jgi:hypothetical protein
MFIVQVTVTTIVYYEHNMFKVQTRSCKFSEAALMGKCWSFAAALDVAKLIAKTALNFVKPVLLLKSDLDLKQTSWVKHKLKAIS